MCAQWRLRSTWASAQSDHSLLCPHEEGWSLAIIRAHSEASDQTGWSESSLGARSFCWFFHESCRPNRHCPKWLSNRRLRHSKLRAVTVNVTFGIVFCVDWHDSYTWLSTVCPANTLKILWGFMITQAGLSLLWIYLSFCRYCCALAHLQLWCTTL